jgi:hypothetical protein
LYETRQDKNEDIRKEINIFSIISGIEENRENWKDYVEKIADSRFSKEP